jgi:hypothetical protein
MPLGITKETNYPRRKVKTEIGDILVHFTETEVSMRDDLMAPIRLFREVDDQTHFE